MKLDLSGAVDLDETHRHWLNEIAASIRQPLNELVHRLGASHEENIDWWVTPVASRNVFACALFLRCCHFLLALRIVERGSRVREIIVETPGLAAALRKALANHAPSVSVRARRGALSFRARLLAGMCYRAAAAAFHAFNQILFSRVVPPASRAIPPGPLVLVDTFVYRDSFDQAYRDRHYPGLLECLTDEERERIFFLPSYYRIRNYLRLFRALRTSKVNFLVKEDYLRLADYAYALMHPLRLLHLTVETCPFDGREIASMVNEAIYESFASSGSIEGLLRYRLARRIRDGGIAVRLLIDWFENQEVDHGSNAGFRRFMPDTPIVGYQGFVVSHHYLCTFPTSTEMRLKLIPQRLAVTGRALIERARAFCPDLAVGVAPAFRFAGLWRERRARETAQQFRILVALPLMQQESTAMLKLMTSAARELPSVAAGLPWLIRVKAHPSFAASLPRHFEVVEGDFDDLLDDCDVLVSAASSVCVQALAHGVPVVILGSPRGLTLNPIPEDFERDMWAVCYTASELNTALKRYAGRDELTVARHRASGITLRECYFCPVTRETVRSFLMVGTESHPATSVPAAQGC